MKHFLLFLFLTAAICGFGATSVAAQTAKPATAAIREKIEKASDFELKDQFNQNYAVKFPPDKPTILIFGDREGAEQIESWVRPLIAKFPEKLKIYGIANLSAVPGIAKGVVRNAIKKRAPNPVLLDWSGDVSKSYGYEKEKANLFVVDKTGRLVAKYLGAATPAELENLYRAINGVL